MPEQLPRVRLLFYRGSGPTAALVRWFTRSRFDHVAPAIFALDGTAVAYNAYWASGVTKRLLTPADLAGATQVCLPDADARYWRAWLDAQVGKRYDRWSILAIALTKRTPRWLHVYVSRQGEWICSRLGCVVAGKEQQAWGLNGPPSPEDLYEMVAEPASGAGE